jgi:uncharacterized protein DUF4157
VRTFVEKPKAIQQTRSAKPLMFSRVGPTQNSEQTSASAVAGQRHFGHDFGEISVNRRLPSHDTQLLTQTAFACPALRLPHFKRIQDSFGPVHDLSSIRAHTGLPAEQATRKFSASAFTLGSDIAFRGEPSLHLAAHEAAHVVQQRSGINSVADTGGTNACEQHADAVADRVVQGRPAIDLLAPFAAGAERPRLQFQKDSKTEKQTSNSPDLDELAKWPDEALRAWPRLSEPQRMAVIIAIAARYGIEFAEIFKAEAQQRRHREPVNYYYGPGITWITPKKLLSRGFRLAMRDIFHEWWVHPKGDSVTRRWNESEPTADSKPDAAKPSAPGTRPTPPTPLVPPAPPGREPPPSDETCLQAQQLANSICTNAERICKLADELGNDEGAKASCQNARRSCKEAQARMGACEPPALS